MGAVDLHIRRGRELADFAALCGPIHLSRPIPNGHEAAVAERLGHADRLECFRSALTDLGALGDEAHHEVPSFGSGVYDVDDEAVRTKRLRGPLDRLVAGQPREGFVDGQSFDRPFFCNGHLDAPFVATGVECRWRLAGPTLASFLTLAMMYACIVT